MAVTVRDSALAGAETVTLVPAGTNRRAWIIAVDDAVGNQAVVPAAVFNTSEAYTQVAETSAAGGQYQAVLQSNTEPSATSASADITGTDMGMSGIMAVACDGVDQTTPQSGITVIEGSGTSLTLGIATDNTDGLVLATFSANGGSTPWLTPSGDSPTELEDAAITGMTAGMVSCPGTGGTVNIGGSWDFNNRSSEVGWYVRAASAGGATTHPGWYQSRGGWF